MTCGLQGDEQNALEGEGVAAVRKNMSSTNYPTNECTRKCLNQSLLVIDQCLNGHQLAAVENTTPCLNISLGVCVTIIPAPRTRRMGETQRGQGSVDMPRPPPPTPPRWPAHVWMFEEYIHCVEHGRFVNTFASGGRLSSLLQPDSLRHFVWGRECPSVSFSTSYILCYILARVWIIQ